LLVVGLFNVLRQLERWLHQHIFKVGWLVTKNFQTTTILYYTFFLPGVFLYEFVYWLVAGALDVRAERAITWPEKQEIGELRLNFVRLSRRAGKFRTAIISIAPLFTGIGAIWFIANSVFDLPTALQLMSAGTLQGVSAGIQHITSTGDFWLWAYLLFTISNTMMPNPKVVKDWWWASIGLIIIATLPLLLLGVEDEVLAGAIITPIINALNALSGVFFVIIVFDLLAVAALGTVEAAIERITGDSATFKNGRMIVMRREEAIAQRKRERERQRARKETRRTSAVATGPPSVYKLPLPIPGPPGQEPVTQHATSVITEGDEEQVRPTQQPLQIGSRPQRIEPQVITGKVERGQPKDEPDTEQAKIEQPGDAVEEPLPAEDDELEEEIEDEETETSNDEPGEDADDEDVKIEDGDDSLQRLRGSPEMTDDDDDDDDDELTYEDFEDPA
jgi:hypothetical protein